MIDKEPEKESPARPDGIETEGDEKAEVGENRQTAPPHETDESKDTPGVTDESPTAGDVVESSEGAGDVMPSEEPSPARDDENGTPKEIVHEESGSAVEDSSAESPLPEEEAIRPLAHDEVRGSVEAVLYAASEPLSPRDLRKILPEVGTDEIKQCLQELLELYHGEGRGLQIVEVAGGFQITTRPEFHERVSTLFHFKPPSKISIQALETLATIAYRQPITVPEIQELRGVRSTSVIRTLLEKKLIRITGRKAVVGRPLLYGTTKKFLLRFGLKDLGELPRLEDMAEVFGEDMALQLDELGGVGGPLPSGEGDEYPSGIISSDEPADASNGDKVSSETESEKTEDLPFDADGEDSTNDSKSEQNS
jgi:segregation and condensation protein B